MHAQLTYRGEYSDRLKATLDLLSFFAFSFFAFVLSCTLLLFVLSVLLFQIVFHADLLAAGAAILTPRWVASCKPHTSVSQPCSPPIFCSAPPVR